jgi:hypothetical protein
MAQSHLTQDHGLPHQVGLAARRLALVWNPQHLRVDQTDQTHQILQDQKNDRPKKQVNLAVYSSMVFPSNHRPSNHR